MSENADSAAAFATPGAGGATEPELVAFTDCDLIGVNRSLMLVINRQNGNQQIISPQVVDGLRTCTRFKTIEAHAAELARTRPELQGQESMAAQALANLDNAGMLLRASGVGAELSRPLARELPATRVFIITCDRPQAVERLLDSLLQNGKLGRHEAFFLVDDSRDPASRAANRESVARFNLSSPREMHYVGAEAQQALLGGLVGALPQHELGIRFLLDPQLWVQAKTIGRSRTLCLLLSVGYRALVMDDDTLCQAMLPPVAEEGVGIGVVARQAAFYESEQDMLRRNRPAGFDPLEGHAAYLGANLGLAMRELNGGALRPAQLADCNAALVNSLAADSPIMVTQNGSLGDPGTGSAHWVLTQGESSMRRLVEAPQGIRRVAESRLSWHGSTRPYFNKTPFMSQLTGLDNSHLLPPYFPAFRGEDTLFAAMLVAVQPRSVSLDYGFCVPHLPVDNRFLSVDDPIARGGDISMFTRYLTEHVDFDDSISPEHTLRYLGQGLLRLASRSDRKLALDFRREHALEQADYLRVLQEQLRRTEPLGSAELEAYLRRGVDELQQALTSVDSPTRMAGVPAGATEADVLARFREIAKGFAAALDGWVEMRDTAARLVDGMIDSGELLPR
jgi:hypothetical protein